MSRGVGWGRQAGPLNSTIWLLPASQARSCVSTCLRACAWQTKGKMPSAHFPSHTFLQKGLISLGSSMAWTHRAGGRKPQTPSFGCEGSADTSDRMELGLSTRWHSRTFFALTFCWWKRYHFYTVPKHGTRTWSHFMGLFYVLLTDPLSFQWFIFHLIWLLTCWMCVGGFWGLPHTSQLQRGDYSGSWVRPWL